jgi:hypothetical protein
MNNGSSNNSNNNSNSSRRGGGDFDDAGASSPGDMLDAIEDQLVVAAEMIGNSVSRHDYDAALHERDAALSAGHNASDSFATAERRLREILDHMGVESADAVEATVRALNNAHNVLQHINTSSVPDGTSPRRAPLESLCRDAVEAHRRVFETASLLQRSVNTVSTYMGAPQVPLHGLKEDDMERWVSAVGRAFNGKSSLTERLERLVAHCRAMGLHPAASSREGSQASSRDDGADRAMNQLHAIITGAGAHMQKLTHEWQQTKDLAARLEIEATTIRAKAKEERRAVSSRVQQMRELVQKKLEDDRRSQEQLKNMDVCLSEALRETQRSTMDRETLATQVREMQRLVRHKRNTDEEAERDIRSLLQSYAATVSGSIATSADVSSVNHNMSGASHMPPPRR